MPRHTSDTRRRRGLTLWVSLSSGLAIRDLWLATHGGGATPRWLLRAETVAFCSSALAGLAALRSPSGSTHGAGAKTFTNATAVLGAAAALMHGVRLAIYLRAAREKPAQ